MLKPTVRYNPSDVGTFVAVGTRAEVLALDHPRFGRQFVFTSTVQEYDPASGVFETLNTKYVPDFE